jgi:hypothetical protein
MAYFRVKNVPSAAKFDTPFQVVPWTGQGSGYMVTNGACLSTFSFDTGTFVPIRGLNQKLNFLPNEKIYIEFTMLPNLQVSGAEIMCNAVGTVNDWPTYPSMFQIKPEDILDSKGRVKTIVNGKRQVKCYALIAYRQDDTKKNGGNKPAVKTVEGSAPVQILNTDIIMLASIVSGVPVAFPSPFYGAASHINAIEADVKANALQNGSK